MSFESGDAVIAKRWGGWYADRVVAVIGEFVELEFNGCSPLADVRKADDPDAVRDMQVTMKARHGEEIERALVAFENDPSDEHAERLRYLSRNILAAEGGEEA